MSIEKKTSKLSLIIGVAACLLIGGTVFYSHQKGEESNKYIPKMGLPNGEEFLDLLEETTLYWSSKADLASYLPKKLPRSEPKEETTPDQDSIRPAPVLYIEKFDDPETKISQPVSEKVASDEPENITEQAQVKEKVEVMVSSEPVSPPSPPPYKYDIEEDNLQVEGVLVPQETTVISSSRDGKIKEIFVDNGDLFEQGDILLTYDCQGLNAEIDALKQAEKLAKKKVEKGRELFKLDIISDLEHMELEVEEKKALAQNRALLSELDSCIIRAAYDGRVTNRLANAEEYTRTDRVLMETASRGAMDVEFIVPSRWLRYLNTGAPINIRIAETNTTYQADINRIHGEVDPVSQSIQMSATLKDYKDPLLPGMSGLVEINAHEIREQGIRGYLEIFETVTDQKIGQKQKTSSGRLKNLKEKIKVGAVDG